MMTKRKEGEPEGEKVRLRYLCLGKARWVPFDAVVDELSFN